MTAITYYTSNIKNELIKLKGTFAFWLTVISGLIIPVLFFIVYLVKYKSLIPAEGINPWEKFMINQVKNSLFSANKLFPLLYYICRFACLTII